jgi:hypothetical protein
MNSMSEEDQLTIATAASLLQSYPSQGPVRQFTEKDNHLNPKIFSKLFLTLLQPFREGPILPRPLLQALQ